MTFSGDWAVFGAAGRTRRRNERRLAHIDRAGRLVDPHGMWIYLGARTGSNVIARIDPGAGLLKIANESLLALALDVLERVEAATHSPQFNHPGRFPPSRKEIQFDPRPSPQQR